MCNDFQQKEFLTSIQNDLSALGLQMIVWTPPHDVMCKTPCSCETCNWMSKMFHHRIQFYYRFLNSASWDVLRYTLVHINFPGDPEDIDSILLWHIKCRTLPIVQHWDPSQTISHFFVNVSTIRHLFTPLLPLLPSLTFYAIITNWWAEVIKT
jgi:hypothetical protein